jgi:hypothetical protein
MENLSTELDESIANRLAGPELSALSKTSKYYRAIAEPHLYRDLTFSIHDHQSIDMLLLTLLERPQLAQHIQSLILGEDAAASVGKERKSDTERAYWDNINAIRDLVSDFTSPEFKDFALKRLGYILNGASVTIILCLATNIKHISLSGHMSLTVSLIRNGWWKESDVFPDGITHFQAIEQRPFQWRTGGIRHAIEGIRPLSKRPT